MQTKTIHKALKFRLYPNKEQENLMAQHFGCVRFVFNHFLNYKQELYQKDGTNISKFDLIKMLTPLKKQEEYSWLNSVNSQVLQQSIVNLNDSFLNFFHKRSKFPNYKSKKSKQVFRVPQHVNIHENRLFIPKFKNGIRMVQDRDINGSIKSATISKTPTGKYFVSLLVETVVQEKEKTGAIVGLDLGIKDLLITSDGQKFKNNKFTKKYQIKLKQAQQHLSRKKKGSVRYENQRRKVALIHEKIVNSRMDNLHKITSEIVNDYDVISIENLNVKGMVKNHKLSKAISDASWGTLVSMLEYKANWYGKQIAKIDRFFPSSKTCSSCGYINQSLKLKDRHWDCPSCDKSHDRDKNAAINILNEGLNILNSAGTVENTRGGKISPVSKKKAKPLKRETTHL
jgi:putative transposase